jgi:2-deoxy-D-gluconate 3-dehydrogenase
MFSLEGKVALVTGGGRGLGRGIALALAGAGADVALLDRSGAAATVAEVQALGRRAEGIACDLLTADVAELESVISGVITEFGQLDILVNNAGIIRRQPALDFTADNWNDVLQVNLNAVFFLSKAAARHMAARGSGRIINLASMLSFQGGILVPSYTAAKSAVVGLTRALANEWSPLGIAVNAIAPGYFATDNTQPLRDDPQRSAAILERIPAGRWGTPEDLAGVAVWLASDAAAYVHGTVVAVDGGWLNR